MWRCGGCRINNPLQVQACMKCGNNVDEPAPTEATPVLSTPVLSTPGLSTPGVFDDFWGGNGFDRVIGLQVHSKEDLKSLNDFLLARADAEEAYSKALKKIVVPHLGKGRDFCAITGLNERLRGEVESVAEHHTSLAVELRKQGGQVMLFKDTQKSIRKKCVAAKEQADKELDKKRSIYRKVECHIGTQVSVPEALAKLEDVHDGQDKWENVVASLLQELAAVQMQTMAFLRDRAADYCRTAAGVAHKVSLCVEALSAYVATIDSGTCVRVWARHEGTGSERPPLDAATLPGSSSPEPLTCKHAVARGSAVPIRREAPGPAPAVPSTAEREDRRQYRMSVMMDYSRVSLHEGTTAPVVHAHDVVAPLPNEEEWVSALWPYDAVEETELSLWEGQRLKVLSRDEDGWIHGETEDGAQGFFPGNYVNGKEAEDEVTSAGALADALASHTETRARAEPTRKQFRFG